MKKNKILIICMLLGIMLMTSCGKTDHQDQASVATEQTSGDSRQTTEEPAETVGGSEESTEAAGTAQAAVEAVESTESSEYAERKSIIITATNECGIDIGMFSVIDPISGEQYNISAIADGQSVSMPVEWPVEITDFQWALYNQNGELCVEATTDISQAESGVTLLLTGDGNLDDVQEIFE
ncbi:hypothetical protein [Roseburia inulinivorans]|mgnify:FL=1|uniref:Uncharacterized protein n=1 Tax=Roseburia inulinivorans TaxID=360807 RepID=A0A173SDI3_9FIRM|nr:hypothetical protein [Roseburia inulinivorans]CUM88300.1 Uncharacterised protein [Roseburia inulinivorans]